MFSLNLRNEEPLQLLLLPTKATSVPLTSSTWPLVIIAYLVFAFMALACFQKPVTYLGLLSSLATWGSFLSRTTRTLLTRVAEWVAVENWLVSFTSSGGPPSAFLSVFNQRASSLQVAAEWDTSLGLPDITLRPWKGVTEPRLWCYLMGPECFPSCLLLSKPNLYLQTVCLIPFWYFFSPSLWIITLCSCDYFALTSGG